MSRRILNSTQLVHEVPIGSLFLVRHSHGREYYYAVWGRKSDQVSFNRISYNGTVVPNTSYEGNMSSWVHSLKAVILTDDEMATLMAAVALATPSEEQRTEIARAFWARIEEEEA